MLSEVTFTYCKISSCGSLDNPCTLFTLDCTQAVNWRYDFCDIESFHGATNIRINSNTTLKNDTYGDNYLVKMIVYKGDKKLGEVTLKFGDNNSYSIPVKDFGENLKVVFKLSNSKNPSIDMNMALIKY